MKGLGNTIMETMGWKVGTPLGKQQHPGALPRLYEPYEPEAKAAFAGVEGKKSAPRKKPKIEYLREHGRQKTKTEAPDGLRLLGNAATD